MSEFLFIDIKTLGNCGFKFYQTGLIRKVLEATVMDNCNEFTTPNKFDAPLETYANSSEVKRYCPNPYNYVLGRMLYLASNTRPYIYFSFHQCARFTHNTNASHETAVKRIFQYLQGTKDNDLVFSP